MRITFSRILTPAFMLCLFITGCTTPYEKPKYAKTKFAFGQMFYEGDGVDQNIAEAFKWFEQAALQGHSAAQTMVGKMYLEGVQGAENRKNGIPFLERAATNGHSEAQYHIGLLYHGGDLLPQNNESAIYWFRRSAKSGYQPSVKFIQENYSNN